jgi:hypothetical protein
MGVKILIQINCSRLITINIHGILGHQKSKQISIIVYSSDRLDLQFLC